VESRNFDHILAKKLGDIAQYAHDHSWRVLLWVLILTSALGCGFLGQAKSDNIWERYSPVNSVTVKYLNKFEGDYGYEPRTIIISASLDGPDANVLTVEHLREFQELYTDVLIPLTTQVNGQIIKMTDICCQIPTLGNEMKGGSMCLTTSLLGIFGYNETTLSRLTDQEIIFQVNKKDLVDLWGWSVDLDQVLGGKRYDDMGNIIGATTLPIFFHINSTNRWKVNELADK
jgi:hypothetical protein